jgi:hypothetical protein
MCANQIQENLYYNRAEPLVEVSSNWEVSVNKKAILSSPIVNLIEKQLLQTILKIKDYDGYEISLRLMKLWELYQTIKHGYTYDEDTSYNYVLTSIREKFTPKTYKRLRDKFCRIFKKQVNHIRILKIV